MIARQNHDRDQASDRSADKAILDERARALAKRPPSDSDGDDSLSVVKFSLAGQEFAVETKYVQRVTKKESITPLPGAPSFVAGLTNLRGDVAVVFNLGPIFDISGDPDREQRILVFGLDRVEFCLLVDRVTTVEAVKLDELSVPAGLAGQSRDYLKGVTPDALLVLDGDRMLSDDRLFVHDE